MKITTRSSKKSQSRKLNHAKAFAALSAATGVIAWTHFAQADTWANNGGTALNSNGSWIDETSPSTDGAPPSSTDIAQFDFHDANGSTTTYSLGANTSWLGLSIVNPSAPVIIGSSSDSGNTLTLGADGINMSAATQSLTLASPMALDVSENMNFNVDAGQSLTISSAIAMAASSTVSFTGAGTTNVSGAFNDGGDAGAISQVGLGSVVLTGSNSYTGATTVDSGTLELNFAGSGAPSTNIAPSGSQLRLGGGTLLINGASGGGSQTFASTNLNASGGMTVVQTVSHGTNPSLTLGVISLNGSSTELGGLLNFSGPATSTDGNNLSPVSATGTINVTLGTLGGANGPVSGPQGILLDNAEDIPFAVVSQPSNPNDVVDFAAVNGSGDIVGGSAVSGFYTPLPTSGGQGNSGTVADNYDVTTAGEIRFSSSETVTSLRFNTPNGGLYNGSGFGNNNMDQIIVKTSASKNFSAGAILVTPNVGANNILITSDNGPTAQPIGGGTGGTNDFTIYQYDSQNSFIIDGGIHAASGHNNGYAQAGVGTVQINGSSATDLQTNLYGGLLILGNLPGVGQGYALGPEQSGAASPPAVFLNGGNLDVDYTGNIDGPVTARPVTLGSEGGGLSATAGNTLTLDGAVTGTGPLNIGYGSLQTNEENSTSYTLTTTNTNGGGYVILTGASSNTYTGGTNVNYGDLQLDTVSAGTGAITVNSGGILSGTATGLTNVANNKAGGTITPGDATSSGPALGTLGLNSLNLSTSSILEFGLEGNSTTGQIDISKSLSIASSPDYLQIYFANTKIPFTNNGTFNILDVTSGGAISGSLANFVVQDSTAGLNYSFQTASDGSGGDYVQLVITGGGTVYTWNVNGSGSWNNSGNWIATPSGFPNNYLSTADLYGAYTGGGTATINLNQAIDIGTINFNNTGGSYAIAAGSGGSLSLGGNATVEDMAGNHSISAPVSLAANATFDVVSASNTLTISGAISGGFGITAGGNHGAGTVLLTNSGNNYTGTTTVTAGTLEVGNGSSNGSIGTGNVTIGATGTLTFDNTGTTTVGNNITASANTAVLSQNAGELVLTGTNSLGAVNIGTGSSLQVGGASALSASGNLTMSGTAVLDLNGNAASVGSLGGAGTVDSVTSTGASTLTAGSDNASTTFSGVIQNTNGTVALIKAGTGTLTLSGSNSYTGGTTISSGAIAPANNNALGNSSTTVTVNDGDGLEFTVNGITISNPISDGASSAEFADVPSGTATIAGALTMVGGDSYREGTSGGTLVFTGATTLTSNNTIFTRGNIVYSGAGGSLTNSANNITIGRSASGNSINFTVENDAVVSGEGIQIGGLDGSSDDGTVNVALQSGGQLVASGGDAVNIDNSDVTNSTIAITLSGGASIAGGSFTEAATLGSGSTVTMNLNGGSIVANASSATFFPNFANLSLSVGLAGGTINNGGFNITLAQPISGTFGDGGITATGAGTTTLTGANSYNGPTSVTGGTLVIGASGVLPNNSTVLVGPSSTMQFATQTGGETLSSLSIANTAGGTLDITNNHFILNYTGSTPKSTILHYLNTGSNGGLWNGGGIVSSTAAGLVASTDNYGVGYSDGADGLDGNLTSGEIEVAYVQYGDITLSGLVNAQDFSILSNNFGKIVTGGWEQGDFLYSGTVSAEDFHLLAANFGQTETGEDIGLPAADYAALNAFAAANGLQSEVPEPASMGLLAIAGAGLLARRRRRTNA